MQLHLPSRVTRDVPHVPTSHVRTKERKTKYYVTIIRHNDTIRTSIQSKLASLFTCDPSRNDSLTADDQLHNIMKVRNMVCDEYVTKEVPRKKKYHKDWFEENNKAMHTLLRNKQRTYARAQRFPSKENIAKFNVSRNDVSKATRRMKQKYYMKKAKELQDLFDEGNMRKYHAELKLHFGSPLTKYSAGVVHKLTGIKSKDNKTCYYDAKNILTRWHEHFSILFNQHATVASNIDDFLPTQTQHTNPALADLITAQEVAISIGMMRNDKTPGLDGIAVELEKLCMSPEYMEHLGRMYNTCLTKGVVPSQLKDVIITVLHKSGNWSNCDNYRGISLINHLGKVLERVILNRLTPFAVASGIIPDYQYGFMKDRSTTDGILTCRVIQDSCKSQNIPLYMCFIDLQKAYDRVHRPTLWKILARIGVPHSMINLIAQLHDGSSAQVRINDTLSTSFPLNNGLKQGSVFAPCLYNIFMGAIMKHVENVYSERCLGMTAVYNPDALIFDSATIDNANEKLLTKHLTAALFADDLVVFAPSAQQLQEMLNTFSITANAFGQLISEDTKTEVMLPDYLQPHVYHPPLYLRHPDNSRTILKVATEFKYLGSRILSNATLGREIGIRQHAMWDAFNKYKATTFLNPHVSLWQKRLLFNITVVPNATYGCCAWDYEAKQLQKLEGAQLKMLKLIMNQRDARPFNMINAINIADNHH